MSEAPRDEFADSYTAEVPAEDQTALWKPALRDLGIGLTLLSLFAAADAWYEITGTAFAGAVSILDGIVVGGLLTGLIHEWGHFAGARWSGARAPLGNPTALPLFHFDMHNNSDAQFQSMSLGGNIAHWVTFLFLVAALPLQSPGTIAIAAASFGFATFASTLEVPVIRAARGGMKPMEALSLIGKPDLASNIKRAATIGAGAALLVSFVL